MALLARFRSLVRNLSRPGAQDAALDREVRAYLDLLTDEKVAAGMRPDAARRAALVELGGIEPVKEQVRAVRAGVLLEQTARDVRYAWRTLGRAPGFAAVAVITIALGIGANTAIFSVVDAVLFRPLPVPEPDRLVAFYRGPGAAFSYREFVALSAAQGLEATAAWGGGQRLWFRHAGDLERATAQFVSGRYFDVVGVRAPLGRSLSPADDPAAGAIPVAVISDAFWRRRFAGAPGAIGASLLLNGQAVTIVGVAPASFVGLAADEPPDVWLPLSMLRLLEPGWAYDAPQEIWLRLVGRLATGVSREQADAQLRSAALTAAPPRAGAPALRLVPAAAAVFDPEARAASLPIAAMLMAVVTCVLLIACANVANLLLARSTARRRELGVRLAIGASRWRVARQVLAESFVLAILGGASGVLVAGWMLGLIVALAPPDAIPPGVAIGIDGRVLTFSLLLSLATGAIFGAVPAWQTARLDPLRVIKDDDGVSRRGRAAGAGRRTLVVVQVALSVVLVVGAALFVRTLAAASSVRPGYEVDRVLLMSVDFSLAGPDPAATLTTAGQIVQQVSAVAGVESASFGQIVPFSGSFIGRPVWPEGQPSPGPPGQEPTVPYSVVGPGYFRTLGMPLRGRDFLPTDDGRAPRVVVVNETLARQLWPVESALGKRVRLPLRDPGPLYEVIGIVGDGKYVTLTEAQHPYLYLPLSQHFRPRVTLHVRTAPDPAGAAGAVRAAVRAVAPDLPVTGTITLGERLTRSLSRERLLARMLTAFGAVALAIAAVGMYGVLAFSVSRRTREIGVRMALGAGRRDVLGLVFRQSATMLGSGLLLGIAAALVLGRLVTRFLFGVTATDPLSFAAALVALGAAALVATWVPASRALRVDPLAALRAE